MIPSCNATPWAFPAFSISPRPFEFAQVSNRVLQIFERDNIVRQIWTDGRALPNDPDPLWYGYSAGKWADDTTFVVTSVGYDDRTWLGAAGFPHSEAMRVEERYQRVDHDTINFTLKIDDPQAYTKTWVALPRVFQTTSSRRNPPGLLRVLRRERLHQKNSRTRRKEVVTFQHCGTSGFRRVPRVTGRLRRSGAAQGESKG